MYCTRRHWSLSLCICFPSKHCMWFLYGKQALSPTVKDHHDQKPEEHRAWCSCQMSLKEPTDKSLKLYARGHIMQAQRPLRERQRILAGFHSRKKLLTSFFPAAQARLGIVKVSAFQLQGAHFRNFPVQKNHQWLICKCSPTKDSLGPRQGEPSLPRGNTTNDTFVPLHSERSCAH